MSSSCYYYWTDTALIENTAQIIQKTQETIEEKNLTALMITHNLSDTIHLETDSLSCIVARLYAILKESSINKEELFRLMMLLMKQTYKVNKNKGRSERGTISSL